MSGKVSVNTVFFFLVQGGRTPLQNAAEQGHSETVAKLLERGADLGVKTWVRKASVME